MLKQLSEWIHPCRHLLGMFIPQCQASGPKQVANKALCPSSKIIQYPGRAGHELDGGRIRGLPRERKTIWTGR
jgi:hypothetical protein